MSQIESTESWTLAAASTGLLAEITGVWRFARSAGFTILYVVSGISIVHLMLKGRYRMSIGGEPFEIRAGDLVLYAEGDRLDWQETPEDVEFLSIGFRAPGLDLIGRRPRVRPASESVRQAFERVAELAGPSTPAGNARLQGAILRLFAELLDSSPAVTASPRALRWRALEDRLRRDRLYQLTLDELARLAHASRASLVRACREATGDPPHQRLRQLRLAEGASLLRASHLTIGEIALHLRYPRVHEFSRDFARRYGVPPSRFRELPGGL